MFKKKINKILALLLCGISLLVFSGCDGLKNFFSPRKADEILPHLISEGEADANPTRPILAATILEEAIDGSLTKAQQLLQMEDILRRGYRPTFTQADEEVKKVFDKAVELNNRYIKNDFSTFKRIHAIHDYLTYYVEYDQELFEQEVGGGAIDGNDPSFYATGALLQNKAVCDGITRAFTLMCLIEKIKCFRVTGTYRDTNGNEINHAWNKVEIEREIYYNVDATMDVWRILIGDSTTPQKIINHGYFLVSDKSMTDNIGGHTFSGDDETFYDSNRDYDIAAEGIIKKVTSQTELNEVFNEVRKDKRKTGKLEIQIEFSERDKNDLIVASAYANELSLAYKQIKDSDFLFDPAAKMYPYQRYPNGIFMCLIYK